VAFVLAKTTAFGVKVCATGTNGSREAKTAVIRFHIGALNTDGVYAEVSPPIEAKLAGDVPVVPVTRAGRVLESKAIVPDTDGGHYVREVTNIGPQRKKMVGKPR
jgi:hypothetical protein